MQTETEGIILREVKTAAGRTMLLVFSQKYGKISVGTNISDRNSKSKSSLAIKPFTYGRYELYKGREVYNLNGAEVKKTFYSFGEDIDKYISASVALELTEKVLTEEVPEPRIFSLLLEFLNMMEKRKKAFDTLLIAYEVKLLWLLGSAPSLKNCASCGREIEGKAKYFSIKEGGVICDDCHKKIEDKISEKFTKNIHSEALYPLIYTPKFDIVSTLGYFAEKPLSAFEKIALNPPTDEELRKLLREYFSYHLDVGPLKSESMM